ncbi:MAG: SufS family cysteine desulfurase [Bacteroidales bacterium]
MELINKISEIRNLFPALKQKVNGKDLVYFDNGATAQKPISVIEFINKMNSGVNGNIHRAVHELSARSTELYEGARGDIQKFLNAREREEIIFTSGTTASINLVACSFCQKFLKRGDAVIVTEGEHHSNIVPWQLACERSGAELRVLPVDDNGEWRLEKLPEILDNRVKIISVAHISNVLGIVNPVKELIDIAHKKGIPVLVDGAQGVVHTSVDVQDMDCDFYAFSGHKIYGPTGIGILYGKREILDNMPPWMGGGDMVGTVTFGKTTYADLPLKFEAGTPNFIGASALGEAVRFVQTIDNEFLKNHESEIVNYLLKNLTTIKGLKIYGLALDKIPLFSFTVDGLHPTDMAMLMDKMGIALRSGLMCSEPLMSKYGVTGMLRASLAMYNTIEEAEYFIESLKRSVKLLS